MIDSQFTYVSNLSDQRLGVKFNYQINDFLIVFLSVLTSSANISSITTSIIRKNSSTADLVCLLDTALPNDYQSINSRRAPNNLKSTSLASLLLGSFIGSYIAPLQCSLSVALDRPKVLIDFHLDSTRCTTHKGEVTETHHIHRGDRLENLLSPSAGESSKVAQFLH